MIVLLFFMALLLLGFWFLQQKAKQVEQQHELRLQQFMKDLQSDDSSVELVKRIKKNPRSEDEP